MSDPTPVANLDLDELRDAILGEYSVVAREPNKGFHFHTGRRLAAIVGYENEWLEGIPEDAIERFAGTGNPFRVRTLAPGEHVVDLGCGAGIDTFIAAKQVGPNGAVIGIDMTPEMLERAQRARDEMGASQVDLRDGYFEELPIEDGWADVIISNGALNLCPDKMGVYAEINRVLRPGGRMQIADIMVHKPVSEAAKAKIDLWTG